MIVELKNDYVGFFNVIWWCHCHGDFDCPLWVIACTATTSLVPRPFINLKKRFSYERPGYKARLPHIGDEGKNAPETYTAWCWLSIPVRRTGRVMRLSMLCPTIPHPGYSGGKLGNWIINLSNSPVWGLKLWSNPHSFPCYPYGGLGVLDPQQLFPPGSHQAKTWRESLSQEQWNH